MGDDNISFSIELNGTDEINEQLQEIEDRLDRIIMKFERLRELKECEN